MARLNRELPGQGWKISEYGHNNSEARTLVLTADHTKKKFGLHVEFWDKANGDEDPPSLVVTVVSACYKVPEGKTVDDY